MTCPHIYMLIMIISDNHSASCSCLLNHSASCSRLSHSLLMVRPMRLYTTLAAVGGGGGGGEAKFWWEALGYMICQTMGLIGKAVKKLRRKAGRPREPPSLPHFLPQPLPPSLFPPSLPLYPCIYYTRSLACTNPRTWIRLSIYPHILMTRKDWNNKASAAYLIHPRHCSGEVREWMPEMNAT